MPKDEFDPEDPMELVGVEVSGSDPDQALDAIVQEYLFMGWKPAMILDRRPTLRSVSTGVTMSAYTVFVSLASTWNSIRA